MSKPMERNLRKCSASRPILGTAENREYGYRMGRVITRHGVVGLYDQTGKGKQRPYTRLDFVAGGNVISASWDRDFTDRYLKTLATRFAAECVRSASPTPNTEADHG